MAEARTLLSGTKELAVTEKSAGEPLSAESVVLTSILLRAAKANVATVWVGPTSTTKATWELFYPLEAGESVEMDFIDPSQIFLYGKAKDKVTFLGLRP